MIDPSDTDFENTTRGCYKQFYIYKFNDFDEKDQFFERQKLLRLIKKI